MAVYEFECMHCGNKFEEYMKITSKSDGCECPKCNGIADKVISKTSFTISGYAAINGYSKGNV